MTVSATLDLHVAPESLESAPALITSVLDQTRAFDGCLGVDVFVDADDPTHFIAIEHWESAEHDAAYREWRTTPAGASALGTIVAGRPTLTKLLPTSI
jgi:heme oxygenase (mycobilin-producing)